MLIINLNQDKSNLNNYLSTTILKKIDEHLEKKQKIILYLNKRGEYNSLICRDCQKLYKCINCDNSLTVHKFPPKIICHLCWYNEEIPSSCIYCKSKNLEKIWVWTQQIEILLNKYLENKYKVFRLDTDNIKTKNDKELVLSNLDNADIIIWTKMVTTGFNFKKVGLIWVILLEQELQIPKYNTEEKVYSNIKQLIWRWNRKWQTTDIVIQTFIPENDIIKTLSVWNYKDFFQKTLEERKIFWYPPFLELAILEYRSKDKEKALNFVLNLKNKLDIENKEKKVEIILNPQYSKKYNQYYYKIILKSKNNIREFLKCIKNEIMRNKELVVIFDT